MKSVEIQQAEMKSTVARHCGESIPSSACKRLDSWKEIASYLRRSIRCVQRWEKDEGLPILRHQHARGATVYAYGEKLKAVGWLAWGHPYKRRKAKLPEQRFGQLLRLLQEPWEPGHFMGSHECEFCPEEPLQVSSEKYKEPEVPLVSRRVVDGVEIECIQWQTPHLEAYYRRHQIERDG